jgi:hypothetical protein
MPITLDQFANLGLTAGQKTKLQQLSDIGTARRNASRRNPEDPITGNLTPDISAVNLVQAKSAERFLRDIHTLLGPIMEGAKYVREKLMEDAAKAVDDAATPVPF